MSRYALFGLAAGALWGLAFIAPAVAGPFTALDLTVARYIVFGLSSVAALWMLKFNPFRRLTGRDWARIIGLGLAGNSLYYLTMSSAVVFAGPAPVALVIGTMPLAMIIVGNIRRKTVAWRRMLGPLLIIAAGLACTGAAAATQSGAPEATGVAMVGIALAAVALFSWLIYGIVNAEYLADTPTMGSVLWTSLTGLGTLVTVPPLIVLMAVMGRPSPVANEDWATLIFWGLVLGLGASWAATWLWNKASSGLPAAILGLLVVSETVFAVIYSCILFTRWPTTAELISTILIVVGVAWGVWVTSHKRVRPVTELR